MTTPTTVQVRFQFRADTAANWTTIDPVLLANELGRETDTGKIKIGDGSTAWSSLAYQGWSSLTYPLVNADIDAAAAIDHSKLADITAGSVLLGNASNVPTATALSGDVTVDSSGVTAIGSGVIVDADVSASAEIAVSKLANGTANQILTTDGTNVSWTDSPTIAGNVIISGNLTVNGTETIINVDTLQVEDKTIEMGNVTTPTDLTADGGGIVLKGATDKTILWVDSTDSWTSSENVDLASGKTYKIAGTDVLSATTLGSAVVNSSLTSVGNLTDLTVDTDTLYVDATNDRVGVGTATPGTLLTLDNNADSATISTSAGDYHIRLRAAQTNTYNGGICTTEATTGVVTAAITPIDTGSSAAQGWAFITGNNSAVAERMRIDSSGNVGIGTTTPSTVLHVLDTDAAIAFEGTRGTGNTHNITTGGSNSQNLNVNVSNDFLINASDIVFRNSAGNAEYARIDSSGRLLVGISSSTDPSRLVVKGNTSADIGAGNIALARGEAAADMANNDGVGTIRFTDEDGIRSAEIASRVDGTPSASVLPGDLVFSTANSAGTLTSRMTIGSAGEIGIGAAPQSANAIRIQTPIAGSNAGRGIQINSEYSSDCTGSSIVFGAYPSIEDATFTANQLSLFNASIQPVPAAATVTTLIGFNANGNLGDQATNVYGFESNINTGTGNNYNFYASGTADNYFAGNVGIGETTPGELLSLSQDVTTEANLLSLRGTSFGDGEKIFATFKRGSVNLARVGVEAAGAGQAGHLIFETAASGTSTERVRISSDGAIGLSGANYGTSGQVLTSNGSSSAPTWQDAGAGAGLFTSYALIRDQKTDGTDGGTFTSGAWQTRDLNTEVADPDSIVTIASNQFTLSTAGSYLIKWGAPAVNSNRSQTRLYDVTNTAVIEHGQNMWFTTTTNNTGVSRGAARVTITGSTTYEIQHQCQSTTNNSGFGGDVSFGGVEVYTEVEIYKEA